MCSIVSYYAEEINYGDNYREIPLQEKNKKNKQKDSRACKKLKVKTGRIQLQELIRFTQDNA